MKKKKNLNYIMNSLPYKNIDSIAIIFYHDISREIYIYLNGKNLGFILMNNIIHNICYKLNQLSYEIFYTEYNRFNFDDSLTRDDIIKSFKKMHKININFDFNNNKTYLFLSSQHSCCNVDSKKYSYIYIEIFSLLLPYLEKINNINIDNLIFS